MADSRTKISLFAVSAAVVVALDQWTKYKVRTDASWQYVDLIPGWLGFHYTLNPGMAMGIDVLSTPVVSMISILAALAITGYVFYTMKHAVKGYMVLMGMVIGGALGNIIDRIFLGPVQGYDGILQGRVVDFIHFYLEIGDTAVFPYIFNVADAAISVALVTLILFSRRLMPDPPASESPNAADSEGLTDAPVADAVDQTADHPEASESAETAGAETPKA